jgi:dTMP kinase
MDKGIFVVIDGIDCCGSTTQTGRLRSKLNEKGIKVHLTKEPSEFPVGKLLRDYLKKENTPIATDALLFAADRVEHYFNEVLPKLQEGFVVVSDRYIESSIAYQSAQAELHQQREESPFSTMDMDWVKEINKFAPHPDLTFIIDIDPRISLARKDPAIALEKFETTTFLDSVRRIYLERAKSLNNIVVDGAQSINEVADVILKTLTRIFPLEDK